MKTIYVIGAGLAGSEAAYYLANHGFKVCLYEMRPTKMTPAHHTSYFGELVCSNSLKSARLENACGLLKEEMRRMGSLTMEVASIAQVPSGQAFSVDREIFGSEITKRIKAHPNIEIIEKELTSIPESTTLFTFSTSPSSIAFLSSLFASSCLFFIENKLYLSSIPL